MALATGDVGSSRKVVDCCERAEMSDAIRPVRARECEIKRMNSVASRHSTAIWRLKGRLPE